MTVHKPLIIKPGELRCPRCLGKDIVPSWPRGFVDAAFRAVGRIPKHCRACGNRFHARPENALAAPLESEEQVSVGSDANL